MSQQNNNEGAGIGVVIGFICAGMMVLGLLLFLFVCFVAFVLTVIALVGWNRPVTLGSITVHPEEARQFVYRGLAGAVLVPAFAIVCVLVFDIYIRADALPYLMAGGYVAGSVGVEWLMAQSEENATASAEIVVPATPVQEPPQSLPGNRPPFKYASWDDEEAGR